MSIVKVQCSYYFEIDPVHSGVRLHWIWMKHKSPLQKLIIFGNYAFVPPSNFPGKILGTTLLFVVQGAAQVYFHAISRMGIWKTGWFYLTLIKLATKTFFSSNKSKIWNCGVEKANSISGMQESLYSRCLRFRDFKGLRTLFILEMHFQSKR